jgi:hypothetical protein
MTDTRAKDWDWTIRKNSQDYYATETAQLAVLMDIRDELKQLNRVFACHNAQDIPNILRRIDKNTKKRKRKVRK